MDLTIKQRAFPISQMESGNTKSQEPSFQLLDAQKQVEKLQEDYRILVESVKDYAIFMISPKGYIKTWNKGAEKIKGYTASEIIGKHISTFYLEEDKANGLPEKLLQLAIENGHMETEGYRVRKDGSVFWVNIVLTPLYNDSNTLIGFTKITRDLTERKKAEEILRQSEERFRLMIENVKDYAIFMLDPTGHVATWNAGAQKLKGYLPEEIIGQHFSKFYPEDAVQMGYPDFELKTAREQGRFEEEGWRIRKDGSKMWVNVVITAMYNHDNKLLGFCKITRDLTERMQIDQKLRYLNENLEKLVAKRTLEAEQARAEAMQANQRKSQFLANMSHELRSPLNAVIGYTEMTLLGQGGGLTEKQQKYLTNVSVSAHHLLDVVNDLLDIAKIEANQLTMTAERFALQPVLHEIRDAASTLMRDNRITFESKIQPGLVDLVADRVRFKQILANLVTNAIKYNKPNGHVCITLSRSPDDKLLIGEIVDTGIGLEKDQLPNLFQPFYQVDSEMSRRVEGSGLGLSITKHLVEIHGGTISLESTLGVGTTVRFTIPLHGKETEEASA